MVTLVMLVVVVVHGQGLLQPQVKQAPIITDVLLDAKSSISNKLKIS